jgi:flagellar basal-body rod protein FlgC
MSDAMQISRSGMDVEWQRLQVIAQNLANLNTSRTPDGGTFRPQRLVSGPERSFADAVAGRGGAPVGVAVTSIEPEPVGERRLYDPSAPDADAQGFVSVPAIDHVAEMTLMMRTSRAYEANLTALGIATQMAQRALDLGGRA